ncbi:Protein of unknown function, DUF393 [Pseudomonas abietaniphila]|uniref:Thiol-disulfide oxidoreductase DCC n=1 Tax=Pseudomonas abietaniphila TaxID=89065 RepID=A0A1G7VF98_9PSED|nr:Protein of unknown function, DUF393 [Pseudomonas abietaniphila]
MIIRCIAIPPYDDPQLPLRRGRSSAPSDSFYPAPSKTLMLFDGVCKLCNGGAKFLIRYDRYHRVRLATVQSPEGQALFS